MKSRPHDHAPRRPYPGRRPLLSLAAAIAALATGCADPWLPPSPTGPYYQSDRMMGSILGAPPPGASSADSAAADTVAAHE